MKKPGFTKQSVDLNEIFDKAIDALKRYPEKEVVASLIEMVLEKQREIYEKAIMGPEELEKLTKHREEMAKIREESSKSNWDRLTSLSLGGNSTDESWSDVEKIAEYMKSRQKLADRLIRQHESILKLLEKELEDLLNGNVKPGRRKELKELYDLISK